MKILVVSQYYYPETFRINDVCAYLAQEGHDVTVLTGLPNYPEGKIKSEYRFFKRRKEVINGVKVIRVPLIARGKSKYRLLLNYFSFAFFGSIRAFFLSNYDYVYSYEVSPITQVIPAFFVRKKGKLIINCLDLWPESITAIGMKTEGTIYNAIKRLSSWIYKKGDIIVTPSKGFKEYLVNTCNVEASRIQYIPQHAEKDYLSVNEKIVFNDGVLHLLFAGNIGRAQNLDIIIDALCELEPHIKAQIVVDIVGDGSYKEALQQRVVEKNVSDCVIFHGRCDVQEVIHYYNQADACLMTLEPNSFVSKTVPAKLQGYMASGRPIIGAINGSAAEMIRETGCGVVVSGDDAKGLAHLMRQFVEKRDTFVQYGQNGRRYFKQHFTIEEHVKQLTACWEEK